MHERCGGRLYVYVYIDLALLSQVKHWRTEHSSMHEAASPWCQMTMGLPLCRIASCNSCRADRNCSRGFDGKYGDVTNSNLDEQLCHIETARGTEWHGLTAWRWLLFFALWAPLYVVGHLLAKLIAATVSASGVTSNVCPALSCLHACPSSNTWRTASIRLLSCSGFLCTLLATVHHAQATRPQGLCARQSRPQADSVMACRWCSCFSGSMCSWAMSSRPPSGLGCGLPSAPRRCAGRSRRRSGTASSMARS